jgi:hypothetical protein
MPVLPRLKIIEDSVPVNQILHKMDLFKRSHLKIKGVRSIPQVKHQPALGLRLR